MRLLLKIKSDNCFLLFCFSDEGAEEQIMVNIVAVWVVKLLFTLVKGQIYLFFFRSLAASNIPIL